MLREMSYTEFREWMVYSQLEPFDEGRADIRSASIATVIANVNRDTKKRRKPFEISDFLIRFGQDEKKRKFKTSEEMEKTAIEFFREYDPDQLKSKKR